MDWLDMLFCTILCIASIRLTWAFISHHARGSSHLSLLTRLATSQLVTESSPLISGLSSSYMDHISVDLMHKFWKIDLKTKRSMGKLLDLYEAAKVDASTFHGVLGEQ